MKQHKQSLFSSFKNASKGIFTAFKTGRNIRIETLIGLTTLVLGIILHLNFEKLAIILLLNGTIIALEMINSSIETLCDHLHPDKHPQIAIVKDISAGAVWWLCIFSIIIGFLFFLQPILHAFQ